jgi:predicted nucleic acid-binding protein
VIIVDTSVLVNLFRGRSTKACRALERVEQHDEPFAIPAICCQELLQGARDAREWRLLLGCLETQTWVSVKNERESHVAAARIFHDCRRRGLTVRSSIDCLIAQIVLEHDGELLHDDLDFEAIRKVRPLRFVPT